METIKKILAMGWKRDYRTSKSPRTQPRFQEVIDAIPGYTMTTYNHMHLLNSLVKETEARVYLEAGVWVGHSLLAAAIDNPNTQCIGIEDFSRHPDKERLKMARQIFPPNIELFLLPYQEFFRQAKDVLGPVVDVYYYDADHSAPGTYDGLAMAQPFLSEECYIVVDDIEMPSVQEGVECFLNAYEWKELLRIDGAKSKEEQPHPWYNGLTILRRNA